MLFVAEQERKNINLRTSGGREQKAKMGGYSGGHTPYGYKPSNGKMVVVPEEAEVVRRIFKMREEDAVPLQKIASTLQTEGVHTKTGGTWMASTIQAILRNKKTYQGYYRYGNSDKWVKGQHEPILKD